MPSKNDLRDDHAALVNPLSAEERHELFLLMRPQEIQMALRRRAFLQDRKRMQAHLARTGVTAIAISEGAGYAPGTLGGVLSESAVERQMRYNTRVLTVCMRAAGLAPHPMLDEHHKGETGPRAEDQGDEPDYRDAA